MANYEIESREWWVQRWLDLLESYRFKKRLERARNYAKQGNVLSIDFQGAKVLAQVQGTDPTPYEVSLFIDPFSDEEWDFVIETMSQRAIFSAQLLAGEMPENIEEVFTANGLSLFPFTLGDVHSRCSCPDQKNPCKHIGAVYYQLADRFSENPFVLFQLRGRSQQQLLEKLRQRRASSELSQEAEIPSEVLEITRPPKPLHLAEFWQYGEALDSSLVVIAPTGNSDTILDVLGAIPIVGNATTESNQQAMQYLNQVYKTVSQRAILTAMSREESNDF